MRIQQWRDVNVKLTSVRGNDTLLDCQTHRKNENIFIIFQMDPIYEINSQFAFTQKCNYPL